MNGVLAYVADGRLLLKSGDEAPREIDFGESVRDRGVTVAGLARGRAPGQLLYALRSRDAGGAGGVGGVFAFDPETNVEDRVCANARVAHLHTRLGSGLVACNVVEDDGAASIGVLQPDGSALTLVTEGDSLDAAPRWVPREDRTLVYQSAGVGRDGAGKLRGTGPTSIQKIDIRKGELEMLAGDPGSDFLAPQIASDGALYYIRRPYAAPLRTPLAIALEALRRFVLAFMRFVRRDRTKPMLVWGKLVWGSEVRAARADSDLDTPSIVPPSWQLCRAHAAKEEVLARGVVSFDLDDAGGVVFTNGRGIYRRDASGRTERVCTAERIEQVALIA